ncbi:glycosyltransferase family 39 protein [Pseudomonas sp. SBB6]|uniref:glycosyltransferase family 39 protein n=1 Tax=Pseudomonas sp. SBB6 TaxID=2962032 RepID=UPI0020B8D97F|nr:glycosyltransferase family 39 protein [Pseudomonas sp. SBB6]MCP3751293.1 glycosyltransferase family 39 protein [Pseudomonas sp. SBB6]
MSLTLRLRTQIAWLLACLAIVLLSSAVRLYQVTEPVLWYDEAFSVALSALSPSQILFHTARDVHPPLYYLLLHYWMQWLGNDVLAVRGLSVLTGVLTVALGVRLTRSLASSRAALISGLLLALLPIAVRYSQEVRMYSLLGLLLLAATFVLLRWVSRPAQNRVLILYAMLMVAGLYTHYFTVLCAAAHWLYLVFVKNADSRRLIRVRSWWLCNVAIALAFTPWLPSLVGQLAHVSAIAWIPQVTLETLPSAFWQFFTLNNGSAYPWPIFLLLPMVLLIASVFIVRRDRQTTRPSVLIMASSYVPLVLVWLISFAMPLFVERYLVFAAVGLPILLALALDYLAINHRSLATLLVAACLALELTGITRIYNQQNSLNDAAGWYVNRLDTVVDGVNAQWQPGDLMVVDGLYWYFSVAYYNRTGSEPLIYENGAKGDSTGTSSSSYGAATLLFPRAEHLYVHMPQALAPKSGRVWWVGGVPGPGKERHLPGNWTKLAEIRAGETRAMLFAVPE